MEFRPFPEYLEGFEKNYLVTNDGRVFSKKLNDFLKPFISRGGYVRVKVNFNNKSKKYMAHRLVAKAFIVNDDPENKTQVDHINMIRTDNRVENLRWVTPKQNNIYSVVAGNRDRITYTFQNIQTGEVLEFSNRHKMSRYFKNCSLRSIRELARTGEIRKSGPFANLKITRKPIEKVQRPSSAEE